MLALGLLPNGLRSERPPDAAVVALVEFDCRGLRHTTDQPAVLLRAPSVDHARRATRRQRIAFELASQLRRPVYLLTELTLLDHLPHGLATRAWAAATMIYQVEIDANTSPDGQHRSVRQG